MKSSNRSKFIIMLFAFFSIGIYSCEQDQTIVDKELMELPRVLSTENTSSLYLTTIKDLNSNLKGRENETLNFSGAVTSTYNGFEGTELVFVPSSNSDKINTVYTFVNNQLVENILTIEITPNSIIYSNSAGSITLTTLNNEITDVIIDYNSSTNGRIVDCGLAEGFLECTNAIQDQLVEAIGAWGAIIFDAACAAWAPCAGSYIITCTALAAAGCPE